MQIDEKDDVTCVKMDIVLGGQKINTVYAFLVDGMLIDTGPKHMEAELIPFYEAHAIDFVTLTHSHEDHSGTAPWLQQKYEVPIYVHANGVDICTQDWPYPKYRQMTWGRRVGFTATPFENTIQSRNREWKVIYTPGHADDHVALFDEENGTLFSGDLFVSPKPKVIMSSESIPQTMDSIRTLLYYDFDSIFCCHAGYVENGKEMLKQKLDHLETLSEEVKILHKEGLTVEEIRNKFYPKKYPVISVSGGEWDSLHIVSSILEKE
ncbi:MBL fold metallo-hydrolase [Salicibibacter halophilus]|uniref:MBL fold metallo-hydrolase n=1 Tax=Salicibibacter halophilus TaxID=2502791 RepID=A0A514LFV3_9BACI|nr:MBL fold metallo-hydrolase [Salicibibacter halophilus]QDI90131.1 MBL fold metallo-hydrolase [Salicibibacter halophilus]